MSLTNNKNPPLLAEAQWAQWMQAGLEGDAEAYRCLLKAVVPTLRRMVRQGLIRAGAGDADTEDVVQEVLLAVHLKRHTWLRDQPFLPWLNAIARHKMIDTLRRRGRRGEVPIGNLVDTLPDQDENPVESQGELVKLVSRLEGRQRQIVMEISLHGGSIRETAKKLSLSDGAVRVALHRGLKRLAKLYRSDEIK